MFKFRLNALAHLFECCSVFSAERKRRIVSIESKCITAVVNDKLSWQLKNVMVVQVLSLFGW